MTEQFTKLEGGNDRERCVSYSVRGFWASQCVQVTQYRHYSTREWLPPEINWSTGGRAKDSDNIDAAKCFAAAILDAAEVAKRWAADAQK